jgi:ATP diphosphatase
MTPSRDIDRLIAIMAALRTPGTGCPWDLEQNFATIAPYTIEEACEVADAIARHDLSDLRDELGDLLLQVAFHARLAQEKGAFDFGDVVQAITEKLIRRHPHVFAPDETRPEVREVNAQWDRIKAEEKAERAARRGETVEGIESTLAGVPGSLPALMRAHKLQAKASKVGFDWPEIGGTFAKVHEEIDEVADAVTEGDQAAAAEEIGDLLFAVVNLARHAGVEPEGALRAANVKFERRFGAIEAALAAEGKTLAESSLDEMDALWDAAKKRE